MIDLHSHILYGIDDGASSLDESKKIIESAIKNGVNHIFATSHYVDESTFEVDNSQKNQLLSQLKEIYSKQVNLYLGNEIYISDNIIDLIKDNKIATLANSNYILIELPVYNEYPDLDRYLFYLQSNGFQIIIAHPERYYYFQNDFEKVLSLCKRGIYFQGNFMSLYGNYGEKAKKLFIKILKHRCYSFVGSDIHSPRSHAYDKMHEAYKKCIKLTTTTYADAIFNKNGLKVIENVKIETSIIEKTNIFKRIRGKVQ